jgi:glycerol-3-phosphate acyltransferase PlsY
MMNLVAIALSYVLGSVPSGLWLGKTFKGIDIREHGSGNIGAANTLRVLGKKFGAVTLMADAAKGFISVIVFARLGTWPELPLLCGIAAIIGHMVSIFLKFKGGKGVATGAGMYLALAPLAMIGAGIAFALVAKTTRIASASSLTATAVLGVVVLATATTWPLRFVTLLVVLMVFYKHRSNIRRIIQGNENRF